LKILNCTSFQQSKIVTNAFKENKYGIKALTFWPRKTDSLLIAKAKIFRLSFRKYFIFFASSGLFGAKKGKGVVII
jgi:hypothetical protein